MSKKKASIRAFRKGYQPYHPNGIGDVPKQIRWRLVLKRRITKILTHDGLWYAGDSPEPPINERFHERVKREKRWSRDE